MNSTQPKSEGYGKTTIPDNQSPPLPNPPPVPAGGIPAASGSRAARTGEKGEGAGDTLRVFPIIDATDRAIIVATQGGLPLVARPYHAIAEQLRIPAEEVMRRICRMQDSGVIRRIGVVPNHYALGYRANGMSVWNVPDEEVDRLGELVGRFEFVSHCYRRPRCLPEWPYNLFAMVHGKSRAEVEAKVQEIAGALGEHALGHEILYSTRILKKTGLRLAGLSLKK